MPTIAQLPSADSVAAADLIAVSQGGSLHAISVGSLLAQTQPAIIVDPPSLLGRVSIGAGGPDVITIGDGLILNSGTLSVDDIGLANLSVQPSLSLTDDIVVSNAGTPQLVGLAQLRSLFSAGANISIDGDGIISVSGGLDIAPQGIAELSAVPSLAPNDLIAVSQNSQNHAVTYANLLSGVTIDEAQPAGAATDNDTFWAAQANNTMSRQTIGALWPWMLGKLRGWNRLVIELTSNTTLEAMQHNNAILICSSPLEIGAPAIGIGSGFTCDLLNVSSGYITFSAGIRTPPGASELAPLQACTMLCVTYSGGTIVFASFGTGGTATSVPGQVSNLTATSITSSGLSLAWSPPASGGSVSSYTVQYRLTGSAPWLLAGQGSATPILSISGLQPATSYDFMVSAQNSAGIGPISAILTALTSASGQLPGAPSAVAATNITANGITCSWTAPSVAGSGLVYLVQYRVVGQSTWMTAASNVAATTINIINLTAATTYQIQITASDINGVGPPSNVVSAQTTSGSALVTSITWNLVPTGNFTHGVGAIGVNAHVNPATAAIQFGFSTSGTVPPVAWVAAVNVNTDLWGQYVPTPASAGTWYAWAEGTDGSSPTVYSTPFAVT
jgi:hypothetical protein